MIKAPNANTIADNFKTIQMSNEKFRKIKDSNSYFIQFLEEIGFTKASGGICPNGSDLKFKFIYSQEKDKVEKGNINNLIFVLSLI